MAVEQAPLLEVYERGVPEAFVAGMALNLKLYIWGTPVAQARPRGRVIVPRGNGKPFVQFYEEKKSADWQNEVAFQARQQIMGITVKGDGDFKLPATGRVLASIRFNMKKPASYSKTVIHNVRKPDVDNLAKGVLDGLVKGGIIEDDNLVTDLLVYKRYACQDHPEGVEIDLTVLPV